MSRLQLLNPEFSLLPLHLTKHPTRSRAYILNTGALDNMSIENPILLAGTSRSEGIFARFQCVRVLKILVRLVSHYRGPYNNNLRYSQPADSRVDTQGTCLLIILNLITFFLEIEYGF